MPKNKAINVDKEWSEIDDGNFVEPEDEIITPEGLEQLKKFEEELDEAEE